MCAQRFTLTNNEKMRSGIKVNQQRRNKFANHRICAANFCSLSTLLDIMGDFKCIVSKSLFNSNKYCYFCFHVVANFPHYLPIAYGMNLPVSIHARRHLILNDFMWQNIFSQLIRFEHIFAIQAIRRIAETRTSCFVCGQNKSHHLWAVNVLIFGSKYTRTSSQWQRKINETDKI